MAEDDEHDANDLLEEGLEQALHLRENAIESFQPYVADTNTGEDIQADALAAHQIAAAEVDGGRGKHGMGAGEEEAVQKAPRCTEGR